MTDFLCVFIDFLLYMLYYVVIIIILESSALLVEKREQGDPPTRSLPRHRGLGHLHQHGLAHGDIKPEHVLLSKDAKNPKAPWQKMISFVVKV